MKTACPRCGANVSFMPGTQKLYCEYCGSQVDVSEFEVQTFEENKTDNTVESGINQKTIEDTSTQYDEYLCSTCGAQLVADQTTTITDCVYCGSRQIMRGKLKGEFSPKEIIPFKIDRNKFISMYTTFVKKKILAPEEFKNNPRLMQTRGIYVPFNLYAFEIDTYARGEAVKRDRDNTYYKYFEKEYTANILSPQDSSSKFNDDIMTTLEPFDYRELTKFNPVFLNGFLSERGNEDLEILERKAEFRGINQSVNYLQQTNGGYNFNAGNIHLNFKKLDNKNVLLPVWFINTWYKNKLYSYAVNGQTGKVVGEIPLSKPKFYTIMAILVVLAIIVSLFLLVASSDSDDNDGLGTILAFIWGGVVAAYVGIKKRYKNVNKVSENPIQMWNIKEKKNNTYSKRQYKKMFGEAELERIDRQIFRNGINVKNLNNINRTK